MATVASKQTISSPIPRLASQHTTITRKDAVTTAYPFGVSSLIPGVHDVQHYQAILSNDNNFAPSSKCEILEMKNQTSVWRLIDNEQAMDAYIADKSTNEHKISLRIFFCTSKEAKGTTFGVQSSLSKNCAEKILYKYNISPQCLALLLGEPDYWAPGDFSSSNLDGSPKQLEFWCQQPRWNIHERQVPFGSYMSYDVETSCATYVIVCGEDNPLIQMVKNRLKAIFSEVSSDANVNTMRHARDPFLLHSMISHEALVEAKDIVKKLRMRLYDQLDTVDKYAENPSDRKILENLTIQLHAVSQDTDSLISSAEMAEMIAERMLSAHARFVSLKNPVEIRDVLEKHVDSLNYLKSSVQSQKRWLLGYKSRKDIAMNLVFNLVTQQDSATTTVIARETKADSSSMKTIAALTMLFLPGTYLSSVFGMKSADGVPWWMYVAIAAPLTAAVVLTWWIWTNKQHMREWLAKVRGKKVETLEEKV